MTASTKVLVSETGGDQPKRETVRDGVFGGSWRMECVRKSDSDSERDQW
jgi:hypothetical protein